jgi:hypothetical protein
LKLKAPPPPPRSKSRAAAGEPAPKELAQPERQLWEGITAEHAFGDAASLSLLRTALEAHERARLCREAIQRDGMTFKDRFGQVKVHPLLASERDARAAFISAMRALNLNIGAAQQ